MTNEQAAEERYPGQEYSKSIFIAGAEWNEQQSYLPKISELDRKCTCIAILIK